MTEPEGKKSIPPFPTPSLIATLHPDAEHRLHGYVDGIFDLLRTKRRREGFALYACGIFGDGERKSVEPIAARACGSPEEAPAMHRKLLRFVSESEWEDGLIREYGAHYAVEQMQQRGPIQYWILDDTGFIKQVPVDPEHCASTDGIGDLHSEVCDYDPARRSGEPREIEERTLAEMPEPVQSQIRELALAHRLARAAHLWKLHTGQDTKDSLVAIKRLRTALRR